METTVDVSLEGDLNKLGDQLIDLIKSGIGGLRVEQALIANASNKPMTFYVYNYVDSVYWVSAMKVLIAPGQTGVVAASGAFFKIHPEDRKEHEFLVAPGGAYAYFSPGHVESIRKK